MVFEDKYINYINNLNEEVITAWRNELNVLDNSTSYGSYDYNELENAYKEYIN